MTKFVISLLLWGMISLQSSAMMLSPIVEKKEGGQPYRIELKSIGYFYRLNIYDENHILLDSTIQFTRGHDLDAFIVESERGDGNLEVLVVMSLDEDTDAYDFFSFNGTSLSKESV